MTKTTTSKYDQLIIYYFSGTGNAKNASIWIKEVAEQKGINTQLINIDRFENIKVPEFTGKTLIGFCSPTHGFNMPPIVLKFISRFPKIKNADVFILNTRGGLKLSKLFIPGLSGLAQIFPAIILWIKGFRVVGMQPLDLPSNWLILHPGLRQKVINSIYLRCNKIVKHFANKLLDGGRKYKALWSLPIDLAIAPVAVGYYFIGRFFLAKTLVATDACNQCEICIKQCPVKAIKMMNNIPYWTYKCESCMRCVNACPQRAIETAHGHTALTVYITYGLILPILAGLSGYHKSSVPESQSVLMGYLWFLLESAILVLVVFLGYKLLHYFMRYKFFNRIIAYTSLSKYKFWRRYRPDKVVVGNMEK